MHSLVAFQILKQSEGYPDDGSLITWGTIKQNILNNQQKGGVVSVIERIKIKEESQACSREGRR